MKIKVKIALSALGFLLALSSVGWGQSQPKDLALIMRRYQLNLKKIPPTLPPKQRAILEQRFKQQMLYERWQHQARQRQKALSPPAPGGNP
jgi:hypothetical protein